jgi:hypothetical protein
MKVLKDIILLILPIIGLVVLFNMYMDKTEVPPLDHDKLCTLPECQSHLYDQPVSKGHLPITSEYLDRMGVEVIEQ